MPKKLTSEQRRAATSPSPRLFVVAGPGCGKTTVAAERFGVERYHSTRNPRGVLALSFARSATSELRQRVKRNWGTSGTQWPHRVATIDSLMCEIAHFLLRRGIIDWPKGLTTLTVLDTWRGQKGCRYLTREQRYRQVIKLTGKQVASAGRRVQRPTYGIGKKDDFQQHLDAGVCTHEEIRDLIMCSLSQAPISEAIRGYFAQTIRALIVDEAFDANPLDIAIVGMANEAGVPITLIGDPWQALYEFRGARPDLVSGFSENSGFDEVEVLQSFRFRTAAMQTLANDLRAGNPIYVPPLDAEDVPDVALASQWAYLWDGPPWILPQSFRGINNQTDAAMTLLLDSQLRAAFGESAVYAPDAAFLLGLEDIPHEDLDSALDPAISALRDRRPSDSLDELRTSVKTLGGRRPRQLKPNSEQRCIELLDHLATRMSTPGVVLGLTVHQAKGREWERVGLVLNPTQLKRLESGLNRDHPDDRVLYVASTRAKDETVLLSVA